MHLENFTPSPVLALRWLGFFALLPQAASSTPMLAATARARGPLEFMVSL
jgi:hypothetical protein